MTIGDMVDILKARVLLGEDKLDTPVYTACCSACIFIIDS